MKNHEIESWARDILDRVVAGHAIEDSRVELKLELPQEHQKAARQIAGLLNAARGASCLWLVGVNEKSGEIAGSSYADFANWYQQVARHFVELSPEIHQLNVPLSGKTITAVLFDSDRAPYVVKTAQGDVFDVPFRTGTFTRSATRGQLLQILSPLAELPEIEIIKASLDMRRKDANTNEWTLSAWAVFLVKQSADSELAFPIHTAGILFSVLAGVQQSVEIPGDHFKEENGQSHLITVRGTDRHLLEANAKWNSSVDEKLFGEAQPTISVSIKAATLDIPAIGSARMIATEVSPTRIVFSYKPDKQESWGGVIQTRRMARDLQRPW